MNCRLESYGRKENKFCCNCRPNEYETNRPETKYIGQSTNKCKKRDCQNKKLMRMDKEREEVRFKIQKNENVQREGNKSRWI